MFKKLNFALILLAIALLPAFILAQTVHQVTAGDGTLATAIAAAADGDVIELISDGGEYTLSDEIDLSISLIIRGHADLVDKPRIMPESTADINYIFKVEGAPRVEFINLDIAGNGAAGTTTNIIRLDNAGFGTADSTMEIIIEGCDIHDTDQKLIRPYSLSNIDSLLISNSTFYNAGQEGIMLSSGGSGDPEVRLDYAEIMNCTFYDIEREAIKGQTYVPTRLLVDHCTFFNISGSPTGQQKPFMYIDEYLDVVVKNSIFHTNYEIGTFLRLESDDNIVNNIIFWNVNDQDIDNTNSVTDSLYADPLFADTLNFDFTLLEGSPALGYADDGNAAGDLRWDPAFGGPTVHRIEAGENTLYDAVEAAMSGDIIELVDDGGVYLYTRESDRIEIEKVLTIRASAGLINRPIIRNDRPGGSPNMRNLEVLSGGALTLIGLEFDGSTSGDGTPVAKQAIRLRTGDSTSTFLKIEDCYFHNYTENFLRGYLNTVIDTFIVRNSISTNALREGWNLYDTGGNGPAMNYVLFENVTITNTGREAMQFGSAAVGYNPEVIINHVTMDSTALLSNDRVIRFNGGNINVTNATIVNSIMTNQMGTQSRSVTLYGTSNISYSDTFNVRQIEFDDSNAVIGPGMLGVDPMYNDPATLDYRLATGSLVRGMAEDGRAMGDLRWEADPGYFYLNVDITGSGTVTLAPPNGPYAPGTSVTMTAVPNLGWEFGSWVGNVFPPSQNPINITMNSDETVTAIFNSLTPQVTLEIDTVGLGYVTADPEPVDGTYDEGTSITLTAVPRANWEFVEWLGDISGTENPTTFTADSNMNVTASFQSTFTQFELLVNVVGEGSVSQDPPPIIATYDTAAVVELTASAVLGWDFMGWSGDVISDDNPLSVQMDSNITVTATFGETQYSSNSLEIDTSWSLYDAVELANNNSIIDTLVLVTSGGLYTSYNTSDVAIRKPLTIMAQPGLAAKPILTNSDPEASNIDIFRAFDDFTLMGVVMDGGNELSNGMKYGIRLRNADPDTVRTGTDITVMDCDFIDFFEGKNLAADGHAFKIDVDMVAGDIHFENCTFTNFGYEAIRISDTEKYPTETALESLTMRNCTFTNIDAEAVRYYSDLNSETPDAPVILEHITINNSATRVFYLKNSEGAIVRDIIIANSRQSGHGRDGDIMDAQGIGTVVSHIDTFNVTPVEIRSGDGGTVDTTTIYGFDPMFVDAENLDYTLAEGSPAYGMAHDGEALGDLRWATFVTSLVSKEDIIPAEFKLNQNYPNPFNPSTKIEFSINKAAMTKLIVYNILGAEVATLVSEELAAGVYTYEFNNKSIASGIYFYRLTSGNNVAIKKMLLVK